MSRYAFDEARHALMVFWGTGSGDIAYTVATLASTVPGTQIQHLAHSLTGLSETAWRTYTHPASAADSLEINSEGWRRQGERDAFPLVPDALVEPNLPEEDGSIVQSYIAVEETAHQVGRALHAINDPDLTERIVNEVATELAAIEQAERGDLSGRAHQAVMLTRAGASPAQVEAADRLLHDRLLGADKLLTDIDPTAAAVAAAHWLHAAANVASEQSDIALTHVVAEADNIGALPHETPTLVLELIETGMTPYDAVTALIRDAMTAAEGEIPNIESIPERISEAEEAARRQGRGDPRVRHELLRSIRATPLDPIRPARDLLEDLLAGIAGCWMLYNDCADVMLSEEEIDEESGFQDEDDQDLDTGVWDEFLGLVRLEADCNRERLL